MFFTCNLIISGFHAANWLRQWARNVPFPLPLPNPPSLTRPGDYSPINVNNETETLRVPKNSCSCECLGVPGWKRGENWSMHRKKNLKPQKATIYVIVSPPEYELVSLVLFLLASGSRCKRYYHHCAYPCFPVACLFAKWLFFITICIV